MDHSPLAIIDGRGDTEPSARPAGVNRDLAGDASAFSAFVISQPTLTRALLAWRGHASEAIEARLLADVAAIRADARLAAELGLSAGDTVIERRVAIYQGDVQLAVAVNRYLPARLPPAIAAALLTGNTPFGALIGPLGGYRLHLSAKGGATGQPLEHRAVVCLGDGTRVAVVEERFLPAALDRRANQP